jgi:hypothetical protein
MATGNRPFPMILSPLIRLSGHSPPPGNKMVFCLAFADIPSCFTENRHGRDDVNHRFESGPSRSREMVLQQVELGRIPLLFSSGAVLWFFALFLWQTGSMASVL